MLLGELGADKYTGLWNGKTDWESPEVIAALDTYKKVLALSDLERPPADWQPAIDQLIDGDAAYNVMGDWAAGYFRSEKKLDLQGRLRRRRRRRAPTGVYDFLSDSFTLPTGATHRAAAVNGSSWRGSMEGQDAFNPVKGSIPARTDADKSQYTGLPRRRRWRNGRTRAPRSSARWRTVWSPTTPGSAEIDTALGLFVRTAVTRRVRRRRGKSAYEETQD